MINFGFAPKEIKQIHMGLFDKLFRGKKADLIPKRPLRLQFPPAPDNAHIFAHQYVDVVKNNDRFQLDYSVPTIEFVDRFLQRFADAGITSNDFAETIFVAGAYVGQVMVLHKQAQWISSRDIQTPTTQRMMPIVLLLPNGTITDPIAQAFRRYVKGGKKELLQNYFNES